jgi:hypothetical protein
VNRTATLFDSLATDDESETQAGSIRAALREPEKQFVGLPRRKATTFVGDFDQDTIGFRARSELDVAVGSRELEGVLQQVAQC